ncbi:putative transcriptional regulator (plasmid) [Oceanithermus profundus DSM 14977]|uniref:Putative transcriptional regulator n=1 Tax=Oceanithermus profundus (strain DSM 14977 / NBRC 100410 / VKM B-2274 / 506) TaxID=670487 RepID=E4UAW5_OCEP5|nr:ATP-binding protein [Oceanithermus profundus]ADR37750.1 putative transcriptional regulator [Oceanithermus profundus DSM 14977]
MYRKIFGVPTSALTEEDLRSLIDREVSEGPYLDYKREADLGTKGGRKEAAKDAAAFANAYGGYLIYGVEEEGGVPKELVGMELDDPDRAASTLEHAIRDLTEPAVEVHAQPVRLEDGNYAIVVEVPRSLNAPLMADGRFYRRVGRSSERMSYMDVRRAFAEKGDVIRKMRERLRQRIDDLESGYGPVRWELWAGALLYVASVPTYDAAAVRVLGPEELHSIRWLSAFAGRYRLGHHADGLLAAEEREPHVDFALMTHEGELFHGVGPLREYTHCKQHGEEPQCIDAHAIELNVTRMLRKNLPRLGDVGFEGPYYLALVLVRAHGYRIGKPRYSGRELQRPFLLLDQLLLDDDVEAIAKASSDERDEEAWQRGTRVVAARLQPVLDRLWQAGGFTHSQLAHDLGEGG